VEPLDWPVVATAFVTDALRQVLSHVLMLAAWGRYPCQRDRKKGSGAIHDAAIT
jgi:hypothetical protein